MMTPGWHGAWAAVAALAVGSALLPGTAGAVGRSGTAERTGAVGQAGTFGTAGAVFAGPLWNPEGASTDPTAVMVSWDLPPEVAALGSPERIIEITDWPYSSIDNSISFNPVASQGGRVAGTLVEKDPGGQPVQIRLGQQFSFTVTYIAPGALRYWFSTITVRTGTPSEPRKLEVRPADGQQSVSWQAPQYAVGGDPTGYQVDCMTAAGPTRTTTTPASELGVRLACPPGGHVEVLATNASGAGLAAVAPEPASALALTATTATTADLTWAGPAMPESPPATAAVEPAAGLNSGSPAGTSASLSSQPNRRQEPVVRYTNHDGSAYSEPGLWLVPPGAPTVSAVERRDDGYLVRITPAPDNAPGVATYSVAADGVPGCTDTGDAGNLAAVSCVVTGLDQGQAHSFTATVRSVGGASSESDALAVPAAPTLAHPDRTRAWLLARIPARAGSPDVVVQLQRSTGSGYQGVGTARIPAGQVQAVFRYLPSGTYRLHVPAQNGLPEADSAALSVTMPAFAVRASARGERLRVQVSAPGAGNLPGRLRLTVQRRSDGKWRQVGRVRRVRAGTEQLITRIRVPRTGTYRVLVANRSDILAGGSNGVRVVTR